MNVLKTIRDTDVGSTAPAPEKYVERRAARAVVLDPEGKVALLHATNKSYHKLPGGGIEEGEDIETALGRELLEEIGCSVKNVRELGAIEEYRNEYEMHQISYCYIADLAGEKGEPNLMEDELADGFQPEWLRLSDAIQALENESHIEHYEGKFIRLRDATFLKETAKFFETQ
ncbi:NUDIX domain-containing protein [Candidatus Kaiserbacteria bacterium]|nr:NUDIX domain-containing protein [Candidatus Kaiserbacteria bacterium]